MNDMKAKRPHMYSFQLPDGNYVGRDGHSGPWKPTGPGDARAFSAVEAKSKKAFFASVFIDPLKVVPAPRWNPESRQYETPSDVPELN